MAAIGWKVLLSIGALWAALAYLGGGAIFSLAAIFASPMLLWAIVLFTIIIVMSKKK